MHKQKPEVARPVPNGLNDGGICEVGRFLFPGFPGIVDVHADT
jgi:hypothetical protein